MTTDPADLRIGDAEREAAAAELGEHYAQGRLDVDEHAERLDAIWAARTRRDLDPIFADLRPTPYAAPARAPHVPRFGPTTTTPRRRRRIPAPLMVLLVVLVAVTVITHLPLILIGLAAWFLLSRVGGARCGRQTAPARHPRWS